MEQNVDSDVDLDKPVTKTWTRERRGFESKRIRAHQMSSHLECFISITLYNLTIC